MGSAQAGSRFNHLPTPGCYAMPEVNQKPRHDDTLRAARQGLVAVRFLCAISFTGGGLFVAGPEFAYQAFGPLRVVVSRDRMDAFEHPDRSESQIRGRVAEEYDRPMNRVIDKFSTHLFLGAVLLIAAGVLGMFIGNRLNRIIRRLETDVSAKGVGISFDPDFGPGQYHR